MDEAKRLIGVAVLCELNDVMKSHQPYNQARYVTALKQLPSLPFDEATND